MINRTSPIFLAIVLIVIGSVVHARITGTTVNPETCWGDDGEEVCVDSSGNAIPTTDNDASLGTTSLRWSTVLSYDAAFGDDVVVGGTAITSQAGPLQVVMPAVETIGAAGTITADACGTIKRITATAARTTSTTDTVTAPAAANAGCLMDILNVSTNTITLDYNVLFNSAGAADVVLGSSDTVRVGSTGAGGAWFQIGGTGNN